MYDDIANNFENPYPGKIVNSPEGSDVYHDVPKVCAVPFFNITFVNFLIVQGPHVQAVHSCMRGGLSNVSATANLWSWFVWSYTNFKTDGKSYLQSLVDTFLTFDMNRTFQDYTGYNVTVDNFYAAILGDKSAIRGGSGKVVESGPNDHIFIYYTDHGGPGVLGKICLPNCMTRCCFLT